LIHFFINSDNINLILMSIFRFLDSTFSALTLLVGQPVKTEWLDASMVVLSGGGADLHMAQLMLLPFNICCSSKSRFVLPSGIGSPG